MDKNDGRVVTNFIKQMLNNKDITIYGSGEQTRSFCYIDDQVEGLIRLMNSDYNYPVNIGNPNEITIMKFAELLRDITGSTSKFVYLPLPSDDPTNRKPDISLVKKIFDWKPSVDLISGLKKTINFIENGCY